MRVARIFMALFLVAAPVTAGECGKGVFTWYDEVMMPNQDRVEVRSALKQRVIMSYGYSDNGFTIFVYRHREHILSEYDDTTFAIRYPAGVCQVLSEFNAEHRIGVLGHKRYEFHLSDKYYREM